MGTHILQDQKVSLFCRLKPSKEKIVFNLHYIIFYFFILFKKIISLRYYTALRLLEAVEHDYIVVRFVRNPIMNTLWYIIEDFVLTDNGILGLQLIIFTITF